MRVKICGITNLEDAEISIDYGANGLGFIFYKKSPHYISPEKCANIISKLPPFVEKVGLFVNMSADEINLISKISKITLAQLHFNISDDEVAKLEIPYIRVVRAKSRDDLELYSDEYRIVDAFVDNYGGAGKRVNLDWFQNRDNSRTILAGGLTPENVKEVLKYNFFGVDVSSGVEERRGKKSADKIRRFFQNLS